MFRLCDLSGHADMLKVVTGAASDADCELVHQAGKNNVASKPYIGLCLGEQGALSRVINRRFTPVTHELLDIAAPGQLTVKQLMKRRIDSGLVSFRKFYLFGNPIQQSLSPAMHNAAFYQLQLPNEYHLCEKPQARYLCAFIFILVLTIIHSYRKN
jgi:pentafunctional AROM polypeptide